MTAIWSPPVKPDTHPGLDWSPLRATPGPSAASLDRLIVSESPGAWFETYGRIILKNTALVRPSANALQERVLTVMAWCVANDVPIRMILLKPRQKGCSTVSMAGVYWLMNLFDNYRAVVIGREYSQSNNLWNIFRTYSNNDAFDWGHTRRVQAEIAEFGNGSLLGKETAEDSEAGRSGTFHAVVATEAARWREGGVSDAENVLNGLLNCVPTLPGTCIIQESTARGASGPFYETWCDAYDFEDFKRRHQRGEMVAGSYIRVFAGWHEFTDSCIELSEQQSAHIQDTITAEETEIMQDLGISYGHIAWRRDTIRHACQRDERKFDREFPQTPEHAFRASAPSRFNTKGLTIMRAQARQEPETWGTLEASVSSRMRSTPPIDHKRWTFHPMETHDPGARVIIRDKPQIGMRYLLAVDNMRYEPTDNTGEDLDHHRALVLRAGYYDPDRGWKPTRIVAGTVLDPKKNINCRWDIDILCDNIWRLACYYGQCIIVPEANRDRGLIRMLLERGANIWERPTDQERSDVKTSRPSGKYGFLTTGGQAENTRSWIIERMARAIREWDQVGEGFEADRRTVQEMEAFIVNEKGKEEAIAGEHDDSVIPACIGLALIEEATMMTPDVARPEEPRDLARITRRNQHGKGQYS